MSKNIVISGTTFNGVSTIKAQNAGGVGTSSFVDTTDANATAGDILLNKTVYVNGVKLTGTIATYDGTVVVPSSTITFSVGSVTYTADSGMTWEQWCASAYNTNSWIVSGNSIMDVGAGSIICNSNNLSDKVLKTDTIIESHNYYLVPNNPK